MKPQSINQRLGGLALLVLTLSASSSVNAFDALPTQPPGPAQKPASPASVEMIELGRQLYFDARLSKTKKVSCNSCHNLDHSGTGDDSRSTSMGINGQVGSRNAPTVWNSAYLTALFWDGRAATLEDQAKGPLTNPIEMGMKDHNDVMKQVGAIKGYVTQFKKVFGNNQPLTIDHLAQAIASFERTLVTPNAPFDRYIKGDKKAISAQAIAGMKRVETLGCLTCHSGPMFNGPTLPQGHAFFMKFPLIASTSAEYDKKYGLSKDLGRYEVTKKDQDKNFWRVATWRNVAITAPYFHNGSVASLDEAVRVMAKTQLGQDLKANEVKDIVAFLNTLTGERPKITRPKPLE